MSDLQDLYQDIVIDHNSRPRNFRKPEGATRSIEGYNPLCGDRYTLYLKVDGDLISDIGFQGSGCGPRSTPRSCSTPSTRCLCGPPAQISMPTRWVTWRPSPA